MEVFDHYRFELLLTMARYFKSGKWNVHLEKLNAVTFERKCIQQIYDIMDFCDGISTEIDSQQTDFIDYKLLAQASPVFLYLQSVADCQRELWSLFLYYRKPDIRGFLQLRQVPERKRLIMKLLLQVEWGRSDTKMARKLIEWAILHHLYAPAISYDDRLKKGHDEIPF